MSFPFNDAGNPIPFIFVGKMDQEKPFAVSDNGWLL
jgi:hypothetical protein